MTATSALLPAAEVHLWWTRLPPSSAVLGEQLALLNAEERARAARFKVDRPRRCHIVAHAVLRTVLGHYTGVEPVTLRFRHGPRGKPFLDTPDGLPQFNLSHSGELVVVALSAAVELGVDVEVVRPMPRAQRLADRFFSPAEADHLAAHGEGSRDHAFFHLWTAKEAYLKAIGTGLSVPLREVEISPISEKPPRIVRIGGDGDAADRWTLLRPSSPQGTICTVAIPGSGWEVVSREWQGERF